MSLMDRARQRLGQWMSANPEITQTEIGRAVGHAQGWVSEFKRGLQDADVDELDAMARVYGHTIFELLDVRPNPKERDLVDAYRKLTPKGRALAIQLLEQMIPPPISGRGRTPPRNGE